MRNYFQKLFAHEQWANDKLYAALKKLPELPPRTVQLCGHLMAAHQFIDKRLHREPVEFAGYNFFPAYSLEQCAELNRDFGKNWKDFLLALPEPVKEQTVSVYNPDGTPRKVVVIDLLTHLFSHSHYHRGQIAADMRAAGLDPVGTDYITFCREQSV